MKWRILKCDDSFDDGAPSLWAEVGVIETDRRYIQPKAADIGTKFGAGAYLVLADDSSDVTEVLVVAKTIYEQAVTETPEEVLA